MKIKIATTASEARESAPDTCKIAAKGYATEADRDDLYKEMTKGHNKHVCKCTECIKIRMAKALEKIEERAKKEGKIPMRLLCYKMERIKVE